MPRAVALSPGKIETAKVLKALRQSFGMSRREFAPLVGLDQKRVFRRESMLSAWNDNDLRAIRFHFDHWQRNVREKFRNALSAVQQSARADADAIALGPPRSCSSSVVGSQPLSPPGAAGLTQPSPAEVSEKS
jgi:hypothetical protein